MRNLVIALLVAGSAPLVSVADSAGTFVAGNRGHILVPVSVNGMDARPFAVDTGATVTVLDSVEFAVVRDGGAPAAAPAPHAQGAHGASSAQVTTVDSIALWQVEKRDQQVALMTLSELTPGKVPDFAGVLGLPLLKQYRVDLDYPQRRLALYELDGELPACEICVPDREVPVTPLIGGLPSVPVTINGVQMTALLDTGASRTILNEAAISALGLEKAGTGEAIGKASIQVGSLPAREHDISRIDLPIFRMLRLDEQPAMILGIDYLGAGRMVMDLADGILWLDTRAVQP